MLKDLCFVDGNTQQVFAEAVYDYMGGESVTDSVGVEIEKGVISMEDAHELVERWDGIVLEAVYADMQRFVELAEDCFGFTEDAVQARILEEVK